MCIVAKSSEYHVTQALQTTLDEGEAMIADSVEYLVGNGRGVLVDAEHFFDGYKANPEFSLRALEAAVVKGASHLVLCDTNGGSLPHEVAEIVAAVTPTSAPTSRSASTATTTPDALWPTRWPRCWPAPDRSRAR